MTTQTSRIYEKHFSPEEANQMLPLVRRIVEDILAAGRTIAELNERSEKGAPAEDSEYHEAVQILNGLFDELEELGCSYKDWNFSVGLVDFPAMIGDEEVLLCWRSDEDSVTHCHGIFDGYEGRREIPTHAEVSQ